ncbi:MAG TPA: sulfotransferase [Rhizomicrobium sp.]
MATLLIHIGMPKTGTTSLQRALSRASEGLLRVGVIYPTEFRNRGGYAHHPIADVLLQEKSAHAAALQPFFEYAKRNADSDILISSEAFTNCLAQTRLPRFLHFLHACSAYHRVRVVMAFRRIDLFMESMYLHSVKAGETNVGFSEYISDRKFWSTELLRSLASLRESSVVQDVELPRYQRSAEFNDKILKSLQLETHKACVGPLNSENQTLGLKAQSFFKFLSDIEREQNCTFRRWLLVRAFEAGKIPLEDEEYDFTIMEDDERLFLHEMSLKAAHQFGVTEYAEYFNSDDTRPMRKRDLVRDNLRAQDIMAIREFQEADARRSRPKRHRERQHDGQLTGGGGGRNV